MDYTIIDAHAHLWLRQDTVVDGFPIRTLENGRSLFMGEIRQMVPPFMIDGVNSAEVFLSKSRCTFGSYYNIITVVLISNISLSLPL